MHINTLKEVHTDGDDYDSDAEQGDDFVPIADRDDQEPDQYDDDTETELMSDDEELIVDGQHIVMKGEKVTPKMVKDLFQVDERMKENAVRAKVRMSLIFASYAKPRSQPTKLNEADGHGVAAAVVKEDPREVQDIVQCNNGDWVVTTEGRVRKTKKKEKDELNACDCKLCQNDVELQDQARKAGFDGVGCKSEVKVDMDKPVQTRGQRAKDQWAHYGPGRTLG